MGFLIMNWLISRAYAFSESLVPDHVVWTALTILVLTVVSWRAWWASLAFLVDLVVVLIFIRVACLA